MAAIELEVNLFQSFRDFSIPTGGSAAFNNALDVQNIISRVTGSSISNIDGLIRANGSANLFLLNPNGIIFGRDAKLDIGGSFIASTANRLNFADGNFFSATSLQTSPLLTVSVPVGLQFGQSAGIIRNQSQATRFFPEFGQESPVGLEVQPNKTLALVGGDVFLDGGALFTLGGRVELGSVAGNSLVSLTPIAEGWALGYEGVQNFQNIQLSQAVVATSGKSGESNGDVQLRGKQIVIADDSQVGGFNDGTNPGGNLALKASESVEVSGSLLNTGALSSGAAGEINIETRRLLVRDESFILASTENDGQGGNLTVNAPESVEVDGSGKLTQLTTQTFGSGNAGNVELKTGRLILRNGGQINSSTESSGNGGNVFIDAPESIEVTGTGVLELESPPVFPSGLLARTKEEATGNGGSLRINTGRLVVQDGASISVAAIESSTGGAGSLDINALESVELSGALSNVLASSGSPKPAGNLKIRSDKLIVRDGATVSVSSQGTGNAGNLEVTASSIRLDNGGKLLSTSTLGKGGGDITLNNQDLLLLRAKSEISTNASSSGKGGNIKIDTNLLVGTEDSDITANAFEGEGGFIQITSKGIFGLQVREQLTENSDITAFSQKDPSLNGVVEINRPDIDPSADLVVLPAEIVDVSGLVAQACSAGGGNLAKGTSELVLTGRGGLPPTPAEATRSDTTLVDLGTPIPAEENRARAELLANNTTSSDSTTLVEAQGWVIGSKGEVILTANPPTVTPQIPWLTSRCNGS